MSYKSFEGTIRRPGWDEGFMIDAIRAATRSTCLKRAVGAVLVRDKRQIASGYAGAPPSKQEGDSCLDLCHCYYEHIAWLDAQKGVGTFEQLREQRKYLCLAVHGESNALAQCARFGISAQGATLYITNFPCPNCVREHILATGITEVKYWKGYLQNPTLTTDEARESERLLRNQGIPFRRVDISNERIMEIAQLMTLVGERTEYKFTP